MSRDVLLAALSGVCLAGALAPASAAIARLRTRARRASDGRRARRAPRAPIPADLGARIAAAGAPWGWGVREWALAKWWLAGACAVPAALAAAGGTGRPAVALSIGAPAAAFAAPDLVLARIAARRRAAIAAEAPELLDRIRLALEAGMPPERAMARAAAHGDGPLAAELRALGDVLGLGGGREAALAELRRRCPSPEVTALAALLSRSARHGAPLASPLAALAAGIRAERGRRRRERASASAPKIQLVVALLLVPAALLVVAAGLVAQRVG